MTGLAGPEVLTELYRARIDSEARASMHDNFKTWLKGHDAHARDEWQRAVMPDVGSPGGLPDGWTLLSRATVADPSSWFQDYALVRCVHGYGVVREQVKNETAVSGTELYAHGLLMSAAATLPSLLAEFFEVKSHRFAPLVRELLMAGYDLADPVEAAEATLVVLGGVPAKMPTRFES